MVDIYKMITELKSIGYPKNVLYKYGFLEFVQPELTVEEMDNIVNTLDNVTDIDRTLFYKRYKECLTFGDIARSTDLTTGQVTQRIDRLLFILIKVLRNCDRVREKPIAPGTKIRIKL